MMIEKRAEVPLLITIRNVDDKSELWFEHRGELFVAEGDVVTIAARVHAVKRSGGYERGAHIGPDAPKEKPVTRREAFSLDIAETFLLNVKSTL